MNSPLVSAYRHSSSSSLQNLERQLFRDVKRLIRYRGTAPEGLTSSYDQMILDRFNALNELEKRV